MTSASGTEPLFLTHGMETERKQVIMVIAEIISEENHEWCQVQRNKEGSARVE